MGQPTFNQVTFRTRDDDGDETGATWRQIQGDNDSWNVDQNYRCRFLVDEQNVKVWSGVVFSLYYDIDGGGWNEITGSTPIQWASTGGGPYYTNDDDCTEQLTGGTGTFVTNNNGMQTGANAVTNTGAINQYFECEFCLTIDSAQVTNGQSITLHVYESDTELNSYDDAPVITVVKPTAVINQRSFRIRTADTETLASTSGWYGAAGADASLPYGRAFRIRFELDETGGATANQAYELRYQKNGAGGYSAMVGTPYESATAYPVIWGVISDQYAHGDAITSAQVGQSAKTFTNGHGVEDTSGDVESNSVSLNNQATELEYCVRIPHVYDGPTYNAVSDYFDFRLYTAAGVALDSYVDTPRVTVTNQSGHIGACPAETQGKWGPWVDGNGNLYYATEVTEVDNEVIMMKSTDDGVTWNSVDDASRPGLTDMESADAVQVGTAIYMAWDEGGQVNFCVFFTSDDGTNPDQWGDSGNGNAPETVVTGKTENDQGCALEYRSGDSTFVCFYRSGTTSEVIKYKIRDGTWGSENDLDTVNTNQIGVHVVRGADSDWLHIFYTTEETTPNTIRHRSMDPSDDSLTTSEVVSSNAYDGGSGWQWGMTSAVSWMSGSNDVVGIVVIDDSANYPYFYSITDDGSPASGVQIDNVAIMNDPTWMTSRTPVGKLFVDSGGGLYFLMADASTQDLYIYTSDDDGATWSDQATPEEVKDGMTIEMIIGQALTLSGTEKLAYIYADRYGGFTDWVWFDTYSISVNLSINKSESITVSDTPTMDVSDPQASASDTVTVADVPNVAFETVTYEVNVNDGVSAGEAVSASVESPQIDVNEAVTASDTPAASVSSPQVDVSETITAADVPAVNLVGLETREVNTSESVTAADSPSIDPLAIAATASEAVIGADSPSASVSDPQVSISESITAADTPALSVGGAGELSISVSDAITVGESIVLAFEAMAISIQDGVSLSEAVTIASANLAVSSSEAVTAADSATVTFPSALTAVTSLVFASKQPESIQTEDSRSYEL